MKSSGRTGRCTRALAGGLGLGVLLAQASGAAAATASGTLLVSATVESTCTIAANPLSFPTYYPGRGGVTANTILSVRCSRGAPFSVAMDAGTGGANLAQRLMSSGASRLQYNLYTNAARTTVWGDGTLSSATVSGTGRGLAAGQAVIETVYGQVPDVSANQDLAPGVYTDTVRVTVSY